MIDIMRRRLSASLVATTFVVFASLSSAGEKPAIKKTKLQIVFLFGQSNMVGLADARTAWYLTQPQYIPPREVAVMKSRFFDWNFYWSGLRYYKGPEENKKNVFDRMRAHVLIDACMRPCSDSQRCTDCLVCPE